MLLPLLFDISLQFHELFFLNVFIQFVLCMCVNVWIFQFALLESWNIWITHKHICIYIYVYTQCLNLKSAQNQQTHPFTGRVQICSQYVSNNNVTCVSGLNKTRGDRLPNVAAFKGSPNKMPCSAKKIHQLFIIFLAVVELCYLFSYIQRYIHASLCVC